MWSKLALFLIKSDWPSSCLRVADVDVDKFEKLEPGSTYFTYTFYFFFLIYWTLDASNLSLPFLLEFVEEAISLEMETIVVEDVEN